MDLGKYDTKETILRVAKEEFLKRGYEKTNLREVAKKAGVTTGAIYNYFTGKNKLFEVLVKDKFEGLLKIFNEIHSDSAMTVYDMNVEDFKRMSYESMKRMMDYIYENYDEMKLVFCCSKGSLYENSSYEIVLSGEQHTIHVLEKKNVDINRVHYAFLNIISDTMSKNFLEILYRNMSKEEAEEYISILNDYHCAGWKSYWGNVSKKECFA